MEDVDCIVLVGMITDLGVHVVLGISSYGILLTGVFCICLMLVGIVR